MTDSKKGVTWLLLNFGKVLPAAEQTCREEAASGRGDQSPGRGEAGTGTVATGMAGRGGMCAQVSPREAAGAGVTARAHSGLDLPACLALRPRGTWWSEGGQLGQMQPETKTAALKKVRASGQEGACDRAHGRPLRARLSLSVTPSLLLRLLRRAAVRARARRDGAVGHEASAEIRGDRLCPCTAQGGHCRLSAQASAPCPADGAAVRLRGCRACEHASHAPEGHRHGRPRHEPWFLTAGRRRRASGRAQTTGGRRLIVTESAWPQASGFSAVSSLAFILMIPIVAVGGTCSHKQDLSSPKPGGPPRAVARPDQAPF